MTNSKFFKQIHDVIWCEGKNEWFVKQQFLFNDQAYTVISHLYAVAGATKKTRMNEKTQKRA